MILYIPAEGENRSLDQIWMKTIEEGLPRERGSKAKEDKPRQRGEKQRNYENSQRFLFF